MELPQSRPFGTAQAQRATHDFLSLYNHSSLQQDPRPSHGGFVKTHNFLEPLQGEEKNIKEDNSIDINMENPPPSTSSPSVVEHLLPGGFGTYTISHISSLNSRVMKPEEHVFAAATVTSGDRNDENSNCSSYTGSGFTLWDESASKKGDIGKENSGNVNALKESGIKVGQWPLDRPSQSCSNHCRSVSPLASQPIVPKNQSFMEMIKSAKGPISSKEEEDEGELNLKKECSSSQQGELHVKVDGKSTDQKANTPRSKHSATEQRRRCKINDRFQMLRELIPHSDQKRDKASFLLEVIEYIQFLQEKVNRYEGPYPGWNSEPAKLTPLRNSHGPSENLVDQSRIVNGATSPVFTFGAKVDERATSVPLNIQRNCQIPAEPTVATGIDLKMVDQQSGITNKAVTISPPSQADYYAPIRHDIDATRPSTRLPSDGGNTSLAQLQLWQNRMSTSEPVSTADKLKEPELTLEGGTISISSAYSQGLLNTLTRALQSSGVDLSKASISVQVDIGKRANNRQNTEEPIEKAGELPSNNQSFLPRRIGSTSTDSDHAVKRLKTG